MVVVSVVAAVFAKKIEAGVFIKLPVSGGDRAGWVRRQGIVAAIKIEGDRGSVF
jgi:hypothetical protein